MFVSLLQRFIFGAARSANEPLQSRADQNTRKSESGVQPERENRSRNVLKAALN